MKLSVIFYMLYMCLWMVSCQSTEEPALLPKVDVIIEQPAIHGLLLFGSDEMYLSQLLPQVGPHHHQMILKVSLLKRGVDVQQFYNLDRRRTLSQTYTLKPEPFVLSELVSPSGGRPRRSSFRATLFRGNYQEGGAAIMGDLTVDVQEVVLARKANSVSEPGPLTYFVFGSESELYAAHWIRAASGFNHIVELHFLEGILTPARAAKTLDGSLITTDQPDTLSNAWSTASNVDGHILLPGKTDQVTFAVLKSHYLGSITP